MTYARVTSSTTVSAARLLTLLTAGALAVAELVLGVQHPLTHCGLIAFVGALVCTLARNGARPVSGQELLLSSAVGIGLAYGLYLLGWQLRVAALLPALLQGMLAILVGRSLTSGRVPVIHRIGAAMQADGQPLPAEVARYARHSTWLWLFIFAGLCAFNALSVLAGPLQSAPALGLIDVATAGAVILLEFFYRRWRFTVHSKHSLLEFWRGLLQLNPINILLS